MAISDSSSSTDSLQKRKQRKPKRSLRKSPRKPSIDPARCLGIDMSQSELNDIFMRLDTGELENPQQALAKVYSLALDAVQNALFDGIESLCSQILDFSKESQESDHFFTPWLSRFLPSDPAKIETFKNGFIERVNDGKIKLQKSLNKVGEMGAENSNLTAPGKQTVQSLREALSNPELMPSVFRHPMQPERLGQIMHDLEMCDPEPAANHIQISEKPGVYHFSFASEPGHTLSASESQAALKSGSHLIPSPEEFNEEVSKIGDLLKDSSENNAAMTDEVTAFMQEIALQVAEATVQAYADKRFIPTLSESLKNDPRLEEDAALSDFINDLESEDDSDDESDIPDNAELANAFSILLGKL